MDDRASMVPDINGLVADRVRGLRTALGWSLQTLADRSGVSRSAISLVERAETSATAAVLEKLASALGVPLAALFEQPVAAPSPLRRAADTRPWTDPASGYVRRNLTPDGHGPVQLVEVRFPPGRSVTLDNGPFLADVPQQVWVIDGTLVLTVDGRPWTLAAGDCLAMRLGAPTTFHNPGPVEARYLVAVGPPPARVRGTPGGPP